MTKCNGHAGYDLMYANEICDEGKMEDKFWGMTDVNHPKTFSIK